MAQAADPAEGHKERSGYRCFLLRCWLQEGAGQAGGPAWGFTVQEAGPDAARRSFASLKDVEAYLEAELGWPGKHAAGRAG